MPTPQTTSPRNETPGGLWATRLSVALCLILGVGFLGLFLIPLDRWTDFFEHPLQATGSSESHRIEPGLLWLRSLLPICGVSWVVTAWLMRARLRHTPHGGQSELSLRASDRHRPRTNSGQ